MSSRAKQKAERRAAEQPTATDGRRYIEYMPLSELTGAVRNPKRHRLDTVEDSFRRFGFVEVPVIDERTGRLVAGHGRIEALRLRKAAGHAAPEGVEDQGEEWLIPVERGKRFASDAEAAAYLVASNRTSEIGGWDFPELNELAREIEATAAEGLLGTGFTLDEIAQAMEREVQGILDAGASVAGDEDTVDGASGSEEEEPVIPTDALVAKWKPALGQLWEITGPSGLVHRVLCGDCRDPENVRRLHQGKKPKLGLHDPPYGIDIVGRGLGSGKREGNSAVPRGKFAPIEGDNQAPDVQHLLAASSRTVLWGANNFPQHLPQSNEWIVWDKKITADGRPCAPNEFGDAELAFVSPQHAHKGRVRIIRHLWAGMYRASEQGEKRLHPTQKPIAVQAKIIEWFSEPGDIVADWYMGAGAVLIACEQLGRIGHGMDIAPAYLAATLERMAQRGCTCRIVDG